MPLVSTRMTTPASPPPRPAWRTWLTRLAPYVITAAVIIAILRRYELSAIVAHIANGNALPMIPIALGMILFLLPLASGWDAIVMQGTLGRPPYLDVIRGKAGTMVLLALGYAFGNGGYGVWIARMTGAGARVSGGVVLYIVASDLTAVCLVATVPMWLYGIDAGALRVAAPVIAIVQIGLMLVGPLRAAPEGAAPGIFHPWRVMRRSRALLQIAGRCFNMSVIVVVTWAAANAFGLVIPFAAMATYMPVILLVGSLPVNVGGLGAVQGVWLLAFDRWAPGEKILAFQFLWQLMIGGAVVLRGLPFVRRVVAEIDQGARTQAAAAAVPLPNEA